MAADLLRFKQFAEQEGLSREPIDLAGLDAKRIFPADPPPKPPVVYSLDGHEICTPGNVTAVSGQVKSGKSGGIGALLAAAAFGRDPFPELGEVPPDLLGFSAAPHEGKAVILFDTEQSPYDAWRLVWTACKRIGVTDLPPNFRLYSLAGVSTAERRAYLAAEMERASKECGGIHSVIIDGVADLCVSPNDEWEACGLVEELHRLAINHYCPIIAVIHENPSGRETGKTRGHLGSQLERKAESNLRIEKDAQGVTIIYSERCRRANIPKEHGHRFQWSAELLMHVTVAPEDKGDVRAKREMPAVRAAFGDHSRLSWSSLKGRIISEVHVSDRTAERRIRDWHALGLIVGDGANGYRQRGSLKPRFLDADAI